MTPDEGAGEGSTDGPWRVGARFRVAVMAEVGDLGAAAAAARLAAALSGAGLPLLEARAVPPAALNHVLHRAAATGVDVLLVDLRTSIAPEAVAELRRAASTDPMIAAVGPRFAAEGDGMDSVLPAVGYALLPDPRGLYVKASALSALGVEAASDETDDPFRRLLALNRVGFRVAVAGRAPALHPDGPPPAPALPPDWRAAVAHDRASAPARADALLRALAPGPDGRRDIAFDLTHAGPGHSGTTLFARALVRRAAEAWDDLSLHVVASPEAFAAHFADLGGSVARADPADRRAFAALIRFGQPFLWGEIEPAVRRAPVLVVFMLDTIGLDCRRDAPDELDALWRFCLSEADGVLFNSGFTERQFTRRFALRPDMPAMASLHSLDLAEYRIAEVPDPPADGAVLLIGNALPHKRLAETATALAAAGLGRPIAALGLPPGAVPGVEGAASGGVSRGEVARLHAEARVVVYPSVYEGFGFPILDALAHRRPVLVRRLQPYDEIAAGVAARDNIHRYDTDADLVALLRDPPPWVEPADEGPPRGWAEGAADLRAVLDAALAGADRARVVRRVDALRGRMSFMRARALGDADDADELDRLAGLTGRAAMGAVLWLGRHMPGTQAALALLHRGLERLTRRRR